MVKPLNRLLRRFSGLLLSTLFLCQAAFAQQEDISIGMSLPLTGFNAATGQEILAVAKAAFAALNAQGGIQGRKVSIVALDDGFVASKAAENARALEAQGVLALFNCYGTSACSTIMAVVNEKRIPMVSGIAGGGPMRSEPGRYAFNVRPTTVDEISRMVKQMTTVGQNRIAVIFQDDPFGRSGQAAAQTVLQMANLKPAAEISIAPDGSNALASVEQLQKSNADGAIVVAAPKATVSLISQARKLGRAIQFYNLAAQAHRKLVNDLGTHTQGVVFTTLVPSPWKAALPIVKDYHAAMGFGAGDHQDGASYLGLEVFINAQILIEGLKRAGAKATRESLVNALEAMEEKRFGGVMSVKYGPNDRNGSNYVGLTMISSQAKFIE